MVQNWVVRPKNSKSSDLDFFYPLRKQWYIINNGKIAIVVSHQSVRTVYHHALACIKKAFAMMIYNFCEVDDMQFLSELMIYNAPH